MELVFFVCVEANMFYTVFLTFSVMWISVMQFNFFLMEHFGMENVYIVYTRYKCVINTYIRL